MSPVRPFLLALALTSVVTGVPRCAASVPANSTTVHDRGVPVTLRDGVVLRAEVLRPAGDGPFPTLVYRTPYGAEAALASYTTFRSAVQRGYAVVVQDVRGRYASDGDFLPYEQEGADGYDTIEWAAGQSWSNGRVGTFGLSYPGAVQWLAAMQNPPHLVAMVPAMTFSTPQNFFYSWGVWDLSWSYWIWANIAPDWRARRQLAGPATREERRQSWAAIEASVQNTVPLDAARVITDVAPYYRNWLQHPPEDPFWDFAELRGKYGRSNAAILNLSAWHDDNYGPEGAITNFSGLVAARGGRAERTALLLGPWVHGVDATAKTKAGDREFGEAARIDYDAVVLDWMDRHVRNLPAPADAPAVRYFVMGANAWKTAAAWPPPTEPLTLTLTAAAPGRPGTLTASLSGTGHEASVVPSDPDNPVRNPFDSAGAHDYRALVDHPHVLTFDSAPLTSDTEVTGTVLADLYVSCDCRDTDIWARLYDVAPDGTAFNLMSPGLDVLRASYREPRKGRQLLTPGEIYELRLDTLVTSNLFRRGHRIRLQVSTAFFPNFSRNLHSGDLETTSSRRQKATVTLHHGPDHPSRVVLPVARQ